MSSNGNDLSGSFPELRALGEQLGSQQAVLDGEIVAFDDQGRPRFQRLQPRIHAGDPQKAKRLAAEQPVVYVLFDLLYLDGASLSGPALPGASAPARGSRAREGRDRGRGRSAPASTGPGPTSCGPVRSRVWKGYWPRGSTAPYLPGKRSPTWTKVKNVLMQEVVIGGWTPGQGHREDRFGSLLLGHPRRRTASQYVGPGGHRLQRRRSP